MVLYSLLNNLMKRVTSSIRTWILNRAKKSNITCASYIRENWEKPEVLLLIAEMHQFYTQNEFLILNYDMSHAHFNGLKIWEFIFRKHLKIFLIGIKKIYLRYFKYHNKFTTELCRSPSKSTKQKVVTYHVFNPWL